LTEKHHAKNSVSSPRRDSSGRISETDGITQYRLAKEIGVPQRRIGEIVAGNRAVTADMGLRLSRFFGISDGFWIGLQTDFDAGRAKDSLARTLGKITPWRQTRTPAGATAWESKQGR
jgi:addiction module HigA family antidote